MNDALGLHLKLSSHFVKDTGRGFSIPISEDETTASRRLEGFI